jgi:hypothetical protein
MQITPPGAIPSVREENWSDEIFTDRFAEASAFKGALAEFRKLLNEGEGTPADRQNVLTFFGTGGVGKSALSQRLQAWVERRLPLINGWGPPPDTRVDSTARIDLHTSSGQVDVLELLLDIRRGIGSTRRSWGTFDLALATYWAARNPGDQPPRLTLGSDLDDVFSEAAGNVLQDLGVAATGAGLAIRSLRYAIREVKDRRARSELLNAYPEFADFLQRCAELPSPTEPRADIACEVGHLLAWELSKMSPRPLVVVFVDTAERLQIDPRRTAEALLNQLVAELPNVFFVISGREALSWHETRRIELPYRGPSAWPRLDTGSPSTSRQHKIGRLSDADRRLVLTKARDLQQLPLDDAAVEAIADASGGLPLYLDLACEVARTARDNGAETVTLADVTGSLGALVLRVLEDVPEDEQRALRAASILRSFDVALISAMAAVDHGSAVRATGRPMLEPVPGAPGQFSMHDEIRRAIREAGPAVPGGWSPVDWERAAGRGLEEAQARLKAARTADDMLGQLEAIALAISLVCEVNVLPGPSEKETYRDWLSQAIVFGPSVAGLHSRVPSESMTDYGQPVLAFVAGKSTELPLESRLELLRSVFVSQHPLADPAGRHLSYELRNHGRWDESLSVLDELIARAPIGVNIRQRANTLSQARRFRQAMAEIDKSGDPGSVLRTTEYSHGLPDRYFLEISAKIGDLHGQFRAREFLEDAGDFLMRKAFFFGASIEEISALETTAQLVGHSAAQRSMLVARVLVSDATEAEALETLHVLRIQDETRLGLPGFRYAFAEFLDARSRGDEDRLDRLWHLIQGRPEPRNRSWIPVECFLAATGRELSPMPTEWIEPADVVQERWTQHLQRYLSRRGTPNPSG